MKLFNSFQTLKLLSRSILLASRGLWASNVFFQKLLNPRRYYPKLLIRNLYSQTELFTKQVQQKLRVQKVLKKKQLASKPAPPFQNANRSLLSPLLQKGLFSIQLYSNFFKKLPFPKPALTEQYRNKIELSQLLPQALFSNHLFSNQMYSNFSKKLSFPKLALPQYDRNTISLGQLLPRRLFSIQLYKEFFFPKRRIPSNKSIKRFDPKVIRLATEMMNSKDHELAHHIDRNYISWIHLSIAKMSIIQQGLKYPKLKSKILDNFEFWAKLDDKIAASLVQLHFDQKQPNNVLSDTFLDRITNNPSAIAKLDPEGLQEIRKMYDLYYDNKTLISFIESNLPDIATTPHKDKLYHYWNTLLRPVQSPTLEKFLQDRITEIPKLDTKKMFNLNRVLLEEKLHPNLNLLYRMINRDDTGKIFNKAFNISQELAPDKQKINKFLFIINKDLQRLPIDEIGKALKDYNPKYLEFLDKNLKQFVALPPEKRAYIGKVFNDESERARKIINIALNPRYAKTIVDQIALTNVDKISDLSDSFIERTLEKMHFSPERITRVLEPHTFENHRPISNSQQENQEDDITEATATDITLDDDFDLINEPDNLSYDDTALYDFLASPEEFEQAVQDYKAHHGIPSAAAEESIASSEHPSVGFDDLDYNSDELSEELHEVIENMDRLDEEILEANDALQNVKAKYPTPSKTAKPHKRFPFFNKKGNAETSKEKSQTSKYNAFKVTQTKKKDSKSEISTSSSTKKTKVKKANPLSKIKKKKKF